MSMLLAHPGFYSVVAEVEGRIVGSNFLDERSGIVGLGPITVDPTVQNRGVGGRLMQDALDRARGARRRASACCRPASTTARSVSIPSSVFTPASPSRFSRERRSGGSFRATRSGARRQPTSRPATGSATRSMASIAAPNCATRSIRRPHRSSSISGASPATRPGIAFFAHSVAETNQGLMALIGAASEFAGPGLPGADAQPRGLRLVPRGRPEARVPDDADDHRPLQRAHGGLHAVRPVLRTGQATAVGRLPRPDLSGAAPRSALSTTPS